MFAASREPSADPAPTSVCSSSMNTMYCGLSISSRMICFRRSSNWPRYLVPATIKLMSSDRMRLLSRNEGTSPRTIRWARPSTIAVLPTPGSPMSTGLFLVRRQRICTTRSISPSRPISGSSRSFDASSVRSRENSSRCGISLRLRASAPVCRAISSRTAASRKPRSKSIWAAIERSSRRRPSSKCSVPMCRCCRRSDSSCE